MQTYRELRNYARCYVLWVMCRLSILLSRCAHCGKFNAEAISIAFPKRLCETCGLAEQKRVFKPRPTKLPVPPTTDGHYVVD
jgi:phage FluMu protein Com